MNISRNSQKFQVIAIIHIPVQALRLQVYKFFFSYFIYNFILIRSQRTREKTSGCIYTYVYIYTHKGAIIIPSANDKIHEKRFHGQENGWFSGLFWARKEKTKKKCIFVQVEKTFFPTTKEREMYIPVTGRWKAINSIKYRTLTQSSRRKLVFPYSRKRNTLESISSIVFCRRRISIT